MKKLIITTPNQANDLFVRMRDGGTSVKRIRYDTAQYKKQNYVGGEVWVEDHIHAIWFEDKRDEDGKYMIAKCLSTR